MTNQDNKLNDMFKIMVDDILDATDEEILKEAIEDGVDIEKEVYKTKCLFNKSRYNIAKKIVEDKKRNEDSVSNIISIEDARKKINDAIKKNPEILQNITMAARSGEYFPDEDVVGYYEDLLELGVIDKDEPTEDE